MTQTDFPAWMYGPNGESRIFHHAGDIPAGWEDAPGKVLDKLRIDPPAPPTSLDKLFQDDTPPPQDREVLENLPQEVFVPAQPIEAIVTLDPAVERSHRLEEVQELVEDDLPPVLPLDASQELLKPVETMEGGSPPEKPARGRPRKLGQTPAPESKFIGDAKAHALSALKLAGVEMREDATDAEIEAALNKLED